MPRRAKSRGLSSSGTKSITIQIPTQSAGHRTSRSATRSRYRTEGDLGDGDDSVNEMRRTRSLNRARSVGRSPRARSPRGRSPVGRSQSFRFENTQWDIDLVALETSLREMDHHSDEFSGSALIFMAARWNEISGVLRTNNNHHVGLEDWISYWDDLDSLGTKHIGRDVSKKIWYVLVDPRRRGRVGKVEIDNFAKNAQRKWRELASKGDKVFDEFSWYKDQQAQLLRRQIEEELRAKIERECEDKLTDLRYRLKEEQKESWKRASKIKELAAALSDAHQNHEEEISRFQGDFCNIAAHTEQMDELEDSRNLISNASSRIESLQEEMRIISRRQSGLISEYEAKIETLETRVRVLESENKPLKSSILELRRDNERATRLLDEFERRVASERDRASSKENRISREHATQIQALEEKNRVLKGDLQSLKRDLLAQSDQSARQRALQEEELRRQISDLQSRNESLLDQLRSQTEGRDDLERRHNSEVDALRNENRGLKKQLHQVNAENSKAEERVESIEMELSATKSDLSRYQGEFCNIPRHTQLENQHDDDQSEIQRLKDLLAVQTKKTANAEERCLAAERIAQTAQAEVERLSQEQKESDENGVIVKAGQTYCVSKQVSHVQIEAQWKEIDHQPVDVDVSVSLYSKRKTHMQDITFDEPKFRDAVILHEDVRHGGGEGEKCDLYLDRIPSDVKFLVVSSSIYSGAASFRNIESAIVKVMDCDAPEDENPNICYFNMTDSDRRDCNAIVMAYFQRERIDGENRWTFTGVGQNAEGNRVSEFHSDMYNILLGV